MTNYDKGNSYVTMNMSSCKRSTTTNRSINVSSMLSQELVHLYSSII